mmetsp:Transcript_93428/g.166236  ORF Transcript_93428/g.166236 Transcript_93428/m.166236 type:complete len:214 (+) Transcript_93428:268-909(+)
MTKSYSRAIRRNSFWSSSGTRRSSFHSAPRLHSKYSSKSTTPSASLSIRAHCWTRRWLGRSASGAILQTFRRAAMNSSISKKPLPSASKFMNSKCFSRTSGSSMWCFFAKNMHKEKDEDSSDLAGGAGASGASSSAVSSCGWCMASRLILCARFSKRASRLVVFFCVPSWCCSDSCSSTACSSTSTESQFTALRGNSGSSALADPFATAAASN